MKNTQWTSSQLKQSFLDFWKSKGHTIIRNASLLPENDPSALFTSAGMHPLVSYLMGTPHESGNTKLANIQRCLRTGDIEEVGVTRRHLTFFEMAGNWSLNDYFKKEAINWSFEYLTSKEWLGLDPTRLYATVFRGDDDASKDKDSIQIWKDVFSTVGINANVVDLPEDSDTIEHISCYSKKENWWGPVSKTGPCGPDTEIFYDTGAQHDPAFGKYCHPNCDCGRFIEIWNNVFMEFFKNDGGQYEKAPLKNVDTGLGIERVILILQYKDNDGNVDKRLTIFSTDLFESLSKILVNYYFDNTLTQPLDIYLSEKNIPESDQIAIKVIIEHTRAAAMVLSEHIEPSNKDRGYVLRRLLRRAMRNMMKLADTYAPTKKQKLDELLATLLEDIIAQYGNEYPELTKEKEAILSLAHTEFKKFEQALQRGSTLFMNTIPEKLNGELAFDLYQSYGFPFELTQEMAAERGITISTVDFEKAKQLHQEVSRKGMEKKFAGGLGDQSPQSVMYHTLTHLLHKSLRDIFGQDIHQQGSNITPERLRFDINIKERLTDEQIKEVENRINGWIAEKLPVTRDEVSAEEADRRGALAFFSEKYGSTVTVYTIGSPDSPVSIERCMGPHVTNTGDIQGTFKITKQEKIGANLLRIKGQLV